jgi:Ni/Fe-hydrogenase 1 B-type cytochrome subunit
VTAVERPRPEAVPQPAALDTPPSLAPNPEAAPEPLLPEPEPASGTELPAETAVSAIATGSLPATPATGTAAGSVVEASAASGHQPEIDRPNERVTLYVWQAPVRITHWVTAACIVVLSFTGGYIADPFLIPPGSNVMSTVRQVHIITALVFLVSGMVRTYWLLAGNRFARWSAFIPTSRKQATELFRQAGFYGFVRKEIPKVLGHNQLAATAYLALFALLLIETVTGFALDGLMGAEPGASGFGWLRELVGSQQLRMIHHLCMWLILAIALFHVYSCVLVDNLEKNGLISSIVSGFKFPTREELVESRDGGPELLERVE